MTRRRIVEEYFLISNIEPKDVDEACKDGNWIKAMEEELNQIEKNNTWILVPKPKDKNVIGTKWVFQNKLNEEGEVVRNKAKPVCKCYSQMEGVDFKETFALVDRIEFVRLFLAYATYKDFKVYQMDIKSTSLNGELEEEFYIEQPDGFQLTDREDMVHRLKKALYGLKQALRGWYARLDKYLMKLEFNKGTADSNLYFKIDNDNILIVEVFVHDIIFGGNDGLCKNLADDMQNEIEMFMIGEMIFLGIANHSVG